ncbi:T9SS type A sorting domain-containing protein [Arcicella sp. LKC2W]|uniref:T9SS type A sorting domain-containing protein n=1 Tax=Arcicella sp. LKC2W TaxID=2984198 RepID=UPI002B211925|nr:T9SS type A sorting domain-containing protein [Arcicella sp. LKC2W]MEA5458257.1 T9SS type A sorting domain-containing protein [Arcicella sp. LKC2W]
MFKKLLLIFLFLSTTNFLYSQITISSPVVRQIFQRDLNNQATVTITGSYSQPIDTIQVRFTPVKANQGTAIDWKVIKSAPLGGLFKGSITVKGGWYTMEVRGLLNGKVVGNVSTLERVGVGEVFVIAGQSNAGGSGLLETKETAAEDDRVNCANFISPRAYNPKGWEPFKFFQADLSQFSIIEFSQLKKTSAIGPMGLGPYYWGKVGDALSAKLNVPIMFFNTAWAGASLKTWRYSAENPTLQAPSDYFPDARQFDYPKGGYPYVNLSTVLKYYGINLGVRAVLWMEGETHNLFNLEAIGRGEAPPTTVNSYLDDLRRLVKRTRQDLGNNKLAWVVARTSYSSERNCASSITPPAPSPIIVNAQNQAITDPTLAPIYPGPFTDNIQVSKIGEREQCVHFTGTGLDDVATAWIKTLTEDNKNFFETVEPILADTIPSVSLDCISSGVLKLSLPSGYTGYEWVNTGNNTIVGNTQSISVNSGSYVARVTRSNGNIVQVPEFTVKANTPPLAPSVKALSDVNFCLGTSVVLQGTSGADNPIYEWVSSPVITNLPRTKDIAATREGTYKLRVVDKNACASPYSTEVKLVAKPRPEKPFVATSGNTALCQGQTLTLTSTNVGASSYLWSNGEKTQAITIRNAGTYNVQTVGTNGCLSPSSTDNIAVIVNSLPATPQIRALSDTVFCDGVSVSLVLTPNDNSAKFGWNRNNSVNNADNATTIRISSTELVKGFVVDTKGCQSLLSNAIQVVKKDNPQALSIVPKSTYSFVARASNKVDEYVWKLDGKILSAKDSLIRTVDKGIYTVLGKNIYKVKSSTIPLTCSSAESEKFDFSPYDDKGLSVYPNPSSGIFTLESRYDLEKVIISVWTTDGRSLYKSEVIDTLNTQRKIDVSSLSEGIYILKIESSTFKLTKLISIVR